MRKGRTREESVLWYEFLKDYPVKFYRQKVIENYIADFYCHKVKLIIEIDGRQHEDETISDYDDIRTEYLNALQVKVLRFKNSQIKHHFQYVCKKIDETVSRLL